MNRNLGHRASEEIRIGPLRCEIGRRPTGYLAAVDRVDGTSLGIPVIVVAGASEVQCSWWTA